MQEDSPQQPRAPLQDQAQAGGEQVSQCGSAAQECFGAQAEDVSHGVVQEKGIKLAMLC